MTLDILTKRKYSVITSCNGVVEKFDMNLDDFLLSNTDSETIYSLREKADDVLDLKEKSAMYFRPNRDDDKSVGIITRIS